MASDKTYQLLYNSRFYVLTSSILLSFVVLAWLRLQIPSDQLFYIRTEQVFGLLSIMYWYLALIISPVGYVIGKERMNHLEFARRAIGVSAFYFAFLHGAVAVWGQLGGLSQLLYLPSVFKWSLLAGFVALVILFLMAITSFDSVVERMTLRRWKWLHRLVYGAGILAVLHIWLVGTHLTYTVTQVIAFIALVILFGLELYRLKVLFAAKHPRVKKRTLMIVFVVAWLGVSMLIFWMPNVIKSYHSRHSGHDFSQTGHH